MKRNRTFCILACLALFLITALGRAQSYPPAFSSTAEYAAGDLVQYGGNWYRAVKALPAHGPYPSNGFGSWELNFVRSNTTLVIGVGQQFPSLQDAWAFALEARIADGAFLHLSISTAHGVLLDTFTGSFSLDHGSGSKISIIGDSASNILLGGNGFPGNGLTLDSGHNIAMLSNVSIVGQGTSGDGAGLFVSTNASINCSGVEVINFDRGVTAISGANVSLDSSSTIYSSTLYSVYASESAIVNLGYGFSCSDDKVEKMLYAATGANINAEGCTFMGAGSSSASSGIAAEDGGSIDVSNGTVSGFYTGIRAEDHSFANASGVTLSGNHTDLLVDYNGVINGSALVGPTESVDSGSGSYIYGAKP